MDNSRIWRAYQKILNFNLLLTLKQDSYPEIDMDIIAKVGSPVLLLIIFPSPLQNFVE